MQPQANHFKNTFFAKIESFLYTGGYIVDSAESFEVTDLRYCGCTKMPRRGHAIAPTTTGNGTGAGAWTSGLCDCCTTPACCMACCCPCCVFGQISAAMAPQEVCCGGNYCGACCLYACLTAPQISIDLLVGIPVTSLTLPLGPCVHCPMRSAIRKKYNIPGNDCEDCLIVWCCACCALAQVPVIY